jgi:nucleotide-binding universal stress UspA family protein
MECIVVGTDGSPTAEAAVREAGELAKALNAHVHIVSGYQPLNGAAVLPDERAQANLARATGMLRVNGVESTSHALRGDPVDAIIGVATKESADLIVVGNRGMTGGRRFLGSVPNKISHHAPCSVWIARTS